MRSFITGILSALAAAALIAASIGFCPGAAHAAPFAVSADEIEALDDAAETEATPDEQERKSDATAQERRLAAKAAKAIEQHFEFLRDPALRARVETIVDRLRPYMERELPYEVTIIDHEMVNAFAVAGGPIYVARGMLEYVKTDLELAGVIAHEMVHADRKHVIIQMARNNSMTALAILAAIASRGSAAAMLTANALQTMVMGGYSIELEKEADARGIRALAAAGYDPVGVLTLQERMEEDALKRPQIDPGIFQTHPETKERIAAAEAFMRGSGFAVRRKISLGLLRARVEQGGGTISLMLDGAEIMSADVSPEAASLFERVRDGISRHLQLETAPYDLSAEQTARGRALLIEGRRIASDEELAGVSTADELRERLQAALTDARASHLMANYFK